MTAPSLQELAAAAGIAVRWTGADERTRELDEASLRALLDALDLPAATPAQRRDAQRRLAEEAGAWPALLTADFGQPIDLPGAPRPGLAVRLQDEHGTARDLRLDDQGRLPALPYHGYFALDLEGRRLPLAIAPARCYGVADALAEEAEPRAWGLAAQVYALRRAGDGGIGDTEAVAELAAQAAAAGGDALGLSPLHAGLPFAGAYAPYSPSHRGRLEPLLAAPSMVLGEEAVLAAIARTGLGDTLAALEAAPLIDWPQASAAKLRLLHALHAGFAGAEPALQRRYRQFLETGGEALHDYAVLAACQAEAAARGASADWRTWPRDWHRRGAPAEAVDFACFAQWLAAQSLDQAQARARAAGMRLGLILDLAVGFRPDGGEAWRHRGYLLDGLSLGAPPDAFTAEGQHWGVTSYSPRGLARSGFRPFVELLRAGMAAGGGIRIDHILGLARLWVVPQDLPASAGGYLRYPLDELLRLVALESWRHRAIVIGEDLGVVPPDLRDRLAARGVLGTDVLLFSRDADGSFLPPSRWRSNAVATTTTHDLPPLAGWRRGRDLDWRSRAEHWSAQATAEAQAGRAEDARRLDQALAAAPAPAAGAGLAEAPAIAYTAGSPAPLMLLPMEDALGLEEPPNLPGTVDEHPNWRRRLPSTDAARLTSLLRWLERQRHPEPDDA